MLFFEVPVRLASREAHTATNVYLLEHISGVPGALATNPARSSTRTSADRAPYVIGWLMPRAPL